MQEVALTKPLACYRGFKAHAMVVKARSPEARKIE